MKEKKYFTKEQIEKLSVAESYFSTAVYANYKRGTMMSLNELIADIYEKTTGEKVSRNWTCANCCLNNYKMIGKLYFESKEKLEAVGKEPEPTVNNNELGEKAANSAKPKGRPKKKK